jgi:hypothetical protein
VVVDDRQAGLGVLRAKAVLVQEHVVKIIERQRPSESVVQHPLGFKTYNFAAATANPLRKRYRDKPNICATVNDHHALGQPINDEKQFFKLSLYVGSPRLYKRLGLKLAVPVNNELAVDGINHQKGIEPWLRT